MSSSAECSRDKLPLSSTRGQDSITRDIVWVSPQGHRSVSVSRHFLLQTPQCPCSVRKRFSRDQCHRGRQKPSRWTARPHTRREPNTRADLQLCPHRTPMPTGLRSSHNGPLVASRSNGRPRTSGWTGQRPCLMTFSTRLSAAALPRTAGAGEQWKPRERCRTEGTRDETHGRAQLHTDPTCASRA